MVKKNYVPERGDIVWIDFNPTRGHEQAKTRPAIVVSPRSYNGKGTLVLLCPITSQIKGYPFEVLLSGKKVTGVVLTDQVRSLDWHVRPMQFIEKAQPATIEEVLEKIALLVG